MRSMVEGGFRRRCAASSASSTTGLRPAVPLPAPGRLLDLFKREPPPRHIGQGGGASS